MKLIALLPEKNESWILPTYLGSVLPIVDEIIAIDDGSDDDSKEILKKAGVFVYDNKEKVSAGWAEHSIRENLLRLGREHGGTHFLCLDADEAFSGKIASDKESFKREIEKLAPGERMHLQWTTLWKSVDVERVDSIYKENYKDFIFCDDKDLSYEYIFLGVNRTPRSKKTNSFVAYPKEKGTVLHYQYVNFERTSLKQAWYKCAELIKGTMSPIRINHTYRFSLDGPHVQTNTLEKNESDGIIQPINPPQDWYTEKIISWFNSYGIDFFEPLEIWHLPSLHKEFITRLKREPRAQTYPKLLVKVNDTLNILRRRFHI